MSKNYEDGGDIGGGVEHVHDTKRGGDDGGDKGGGKTDEKSTVMLSRMGEEEVPEERRKGSLSLGGNQIRWRRRATTAVRHGYAGDFQHTVWLETRSYQKFDVGQPSLFSQRAWVLFSFWF